jgi:hypothetical protein
MTPALLLVLLLLLAQAEGVGASAQAAPAPASAARWHYLVRAKASTLALLPRGDLGTREAWLYPEVDGALRPRAFAALGLGVDNAR